MDNNKWLTSTKDETLESLKLIDIIEADYSYGEHKQQISRTKRKKLNYFEIAIHESSHLPKGLPKTCWIMKLKQQPGKCRLPRGIRKRFRIDV